MRKIILLFSFLFVGTFLSSSFVESNNTSNELGLPPCGATAVGYVAHPFNDNMLVFYVTGLSDVGYVYSWEFTRQNGTTFTASGYNPSIVTSCAFGQRITNWKVTISGFACSQILTGGQASGAC